MMYEIPPDLEQLIQQQMATGKYLSPNEVLREALSELASRRASNGKSEVEQQPENALSALTAAGLVGSVRSGHTDLSSNPKHMEGFGKHGS